MPSLLLILALVAAEHTFHVTVPSPELIQAGDGSQISIPGHSPAQRGDRCTIPETCLFLPVPPGSEPGLEWEIESIRPTGWESAEFAAEPVLFGRGFDSAVSWSTAGFPPAHDPASVQVVHMLGSTVAVIRISPFCFGGADRYVSRISVTLDWPDGIQGLSTEGTLFQHLSPQAGTWWRYTTDSPDSPFWGKPWARLAVDETGFFSVTCAELTEAGCEVSGSPSPSLAMYTGPGVMFDPDAPEDAHELYPVAIQVFDGGDGFFDDTDSLLFYGRDLWHWEVENDFPRRTVHRYDDVNTYWLTWGGGDGSRMEQVTVEPAGGTPVEQGISLFGFEQEVLSEEYNGRTGWVWDFLFESSPGYFYLSSPFSSEDATVRLGLTNAGRAGKNHNVIAELEGSVFLDTSYASRWNEMIAVDGVAVAKGGNLLKVWNDYEDDAFLDYVEFIIPVPLSSSASYPVHLFGGQGQRSSLAYGPVTGDYRIFDVSDPFAPVELTQWELEGTTAQMTHVFQSGTMSLVSLAPAFSRKPVSIQPAEPGRIVALSQEADVLLALPGEFTGYIPEITALYASRGMSVLPVTYREIYDEFGQGVSDPGAVRSFVRWALDTWNDPPEMLQLVGDGSSDPLGYITGYRTNSPVYQELVTGFCLESFFTTVHQGSQFPELPYSRIPASTQADLLAVLEKSSALGDSAAAGPWGNRVMLMADDEWGSDTREYEHTETCEIMADSILPKGLEVIKHYLIRYPWPTGTTGEGAHPTKPQASEDFIAHLNSGVSSATFFGHGSYDQMAIEKLFASNMVPQLVNGPRYFLYNSFSCHNGDFILSSGDCLSENLLNHPGGGAAACMAATGNTYGSPNRTFAAQYLSNVYGGSDLTIAEAFWLSLIQVNYYWNLQFSMLGEGSVTFPMGDTSVTSIAAPDSLLRGQLNHVETGFTEEGFFLFTALASADTVHYVSPLVGNEEIDWLRYGSPIYSGMTSTDQDGTATVNFFVPLQADTGSLGRTSATGAFSGLLETAYEWPVTVADNGVYSDDQEGPEISLSFPDAEPGDPPSVWQNSVLHAELSDESGICVLGDDAGSIVICSIDGAYEDVTDLFAYHTGSWTSGSLDYTLPELVPGPHQVRVVARDGMKNTGEAILSFTVLEGDRPLLDETGVYPNPARGTRAFFFTSGSTGEVSVEVFTVAGRPVWHGEVSVDAGAGQLVWNGLDADGDQLAAGAYVYMITLDGGSGAASVTDLLVVSP